MQHRFIKTAIAVAISALSTVSFAADERQLGDVLVDGVAFKPDTLVGGYNIGTNESKKVEISTSGSSNRAVYILGDDKASILGKEITISSKDYRGVQVVDQASLTLGSSNTDKITINSAAQGIFVNTSGQLKIQAKSFVVNESSERGYAVHVQNGSQDPTAPVNASSISIVADTIEINSNNLGFSAFSNGQMDVKGDITVNAPHAIDVRGNSTVNVNTDGLHKTVLNGDIVFETPYELGNANDSGNIINANVNVGLYGEGSSWTGRAYQAYKDGETVELDNSDATYGNVTGFKVNISDGAEWNMTGDSFINDIDVADGGSVNMQADAKVLNVDAMNVDNATVNMQGGADQQVSVNTLKSKDATLNMNASTKDGKSVQTGKFEVLQSVEDGSDLDVQLSGITADDIEDPQAAMDSVKDSVVAKGATIDKTIAEGDVNGAITETTSADGARATVKVAENTKLASMKGVNAAALVAWRDEVAYTNQRMEFLRDHEHAYGAWGQVYGGESTYEGKVDLKTTTVQVGADAAVGDWIVGAAFSYMNGDADMHNGNADTDAYTVSLYTSRMFDSGLFVNGLARYGRLSTDATAGNMDGEYDNDAFSIGGNVGYRINFTNQAFVEPTFGLQYAYVKGDTYTADNGVKVEQDDFDALIASLGARAGFNFPNDSGRLFARASVNHDFMGEIDGTASKGTLSNSMYVDLGGTWFTYGVGAQFDVTKNLSFWGNIDRTTGGEVSTNYMMNAGLRYVF